MLFCYRVSRLHGPGLFVPGFTGTVAWFSTQPGRSLWLWNFREVHTSVGRCVCVGGGDREGHTVTPLMGQGGDSGENEKESERD